MAEITGKQKRLRRAFNKLKELNTTQAMKKNVGGFNPSFNSNPAPAQNGAASAWDGLSAEMNNAANSYNASLQKLIDGPWSGNAANLNRH